MITAQLKVACEDLWLSLIHRNQTAAYRKDYRACTGGHITNRAGLRAADMGRITLPFYFVPQGNFWAYPLEMACCNKPQSLSDAKNDKYIFESTPGGLSSTVGQLFCL